MKIKKIISIISILLSISILSCNNENTSNNIVLPYSPSLIKEYQIDASENLFIDLDSGIVYNVYGSSNKIKVEICYYKNMIISPDLFSLYLKDASNNNVTFFKSNLYNSTKVTYDYVTTAKEIDDIYKSASLLLFGKELDTKLENKVGGGVILYDGIVFVCELKNTKKCIIYYNNKKLYIKKQV